MMLPKRSGLRGRQGLTLLELVVVLTILAALGGMVVPVLSGYRRQASDSSAVDSLGEISKLIAEYEARTNRYPNNLDSLVAVADETGSVFSKIPPGSQTALAVLSLQPNQVDSLALKGITHVYDMNATLEDSATFRALVPVIRTTINGRGIAADSSLVSIDDTTVLQVLGASPRLPGNIFVVFGFGERNSLAGAWMQEAPYHVPEFGNPNDFYSRYGVVFEIPGDGTSLGEVRFIGTVLFDQGGIRGVQSLAESFYTSS